MNPIVFSNHVAPSTPPPEKEENKAPEVENIMAWNVDDSAFDRIDHDQFMDMRVSEFLKPEFRFCIRFKLGDQMFRIVSHDKDYESILKKYPESITVKASQIMNLWSKAESGRELRTVMVACGVFGGTVISAAEEERLKYIELDNKNVIKKEFFVDN